MNQDAKAMPATAEAAAVKDKPKQIAGCLPEGFGLDSMLTAEQFCKWQQVGLDWFYDNRHKLKGVARQTPKMIRIHPRTYLDKAKMFCALLFLILAFNLSAAQFTVTAFCHCAKCCGVANQRTASGVMPTAGVTCAAPYRFPFGTRLRIQGLGWRTVQDRTASRYEGRIDIYVGSARHHRQAKRFGIRSLEVTCK